jgi:hypothetical protein
MTKKRRPDESEQPKAVVKLGRVEDTRAAASLFEAMLEGVRKRRARRLAEERKNDGSSPTKIAS